jgi:hypothetical protein
MQDYPTLKVAELRALQFDDDPPTRDELQTAISILTDVVNLLSHDGRWQQGCLARNSYGYRTDPRATDAVKWCLVGAIDHTTHEADGYNFWSRAKRHALLALENVILATDPSIPEDYKMEKMFSRVSLTTFNDRSGRTRQDIVDVLQKGIEHLEQRLEVTPTS